MNRIAKVAAIALAATCCGCTSIYQRCEKSYQIRSLYQPTCECAYIVSLPFRATPSGPEGSIAQAMATLMLPLTALDLPFDAVVDTFALPWDIYVTRYRDADKPQDAPEGEVETVGSRARAVFGIGRRQ